ncbi:MAG: lipopolysaccharide biosynthesis protein [Christensenella sp.]|nr:lipopolysaccharide biosynthesis protein [Christensenella sp.]
MDHSFRNKTISGVIWKAMESGGNQAVRFVISVVLARMLDPKNYTTLALLLIFVNIADVFVKRGFSTALVQRKDADNTDFSSVLWASLAIAGILYVALFFGAPAIARFYQEPLIVPALRVVSVILFSGAFNSVQSAIITRKLEFRKLCMATLGATLASGGIGIYMAYAGYGVWALVVQQMIGSFATVVLLWSLDRWKPALVFSMERVKLLFGFGWKLLVSSLLDTGYSSLSSLVIGKRYIGDSLAFYNRGRQYPDMVASNLTNVALSVLFPAYAAHQDDTSRVREMVRKTNRSTALMIFPMMAGLAAVAVPFVRVLLTDKWLPSVPYLQMMCVVYALYPVEATDLQAINALGRSDLYLKTEIYKKIFGLLALAVSVFAFTTPLAIAWAVVATAVFSMFVTMVVMKQLFGYRYRDQLWDMTPPLLLSGAMWAAVYGVSLLPVGDLPKLILEIVAGVAVYLALAVLLKLESFTYLWSSMKGYFQKRKNRSECEEAPVDPPMNDRL